MKAEQILLLQNVHEDLKEIAYSPNMTDFQKSNIQYSIKNIKHILDMEGVSDV